MRFLKRVPKAEGSRPWFRMVGIYAFRVWRRKCTKEERDSGIKYSVKDDKKRVSFRKEVVKNRIGCWEVVEDVAIRGPQGFLSEHVHLERGCDSCCYINLSVSMFRREGHCRKLEGCR